MFGRRISLVPAATGFLARFVFAPTSRVTVEGRENIPRSGPLLIVCNHASNGDGAVLVAYLVPALGRPMYWLGKEEAMRWPIGGWLLRSNGVIGVRRGAGDLEAFRTAAKVLEQGRVLTVFPEGTRSGDGKLQQAREGATVLALRTRAPILPVAVAGSHRFWPRGKLLFRPFHNMALRIGPVFHLELDRGLDRHEATRAATTELMRHIAELLPPEQRGVYGQ